jgi:probable phosphoglycerate mutase
VQPVTDGFFLPAIAGITKGIMPARLILIRHGETAWSLSGQHTGRTDIPLTDHGEQQARTLTRFVAECALDRVWTSPSQRARRTGALATAGSASGIEPDLAEWDYGAYEGRRTVEIQQERPGWNVFRDGCPGGELPDAVTARADRLLTRLRDASGSIALFTHGHFGAALAVRWIGLPIAAAVHFPLGTASVSILEFDPRHPETPILALWNRQFVDVPET